MGAGERNPGFSISDRQTLAERGTKLALARLAMAGVVESGGAALVPLAVLWTWRLDQRARLPVAIVQQAIDASMTALVAYRDISEDDQIEANQVLERPVVGSEVQR